MRKQLTVNLGEQHEAWLAYAQSCGIKPSTLAALVLKELLRQNGLDEVPVIIPSSNKRGLYIRLNPDELEFLDRTAAAMRKTRQKTVIAIIRDAIAAEPQFSLDEEKALSESNYQLSHIGVNLNQIARRVNRMDFGPFKEEKVIKILLKKQLERTTELTAAINKHVKLVWALINAGRYRLSLTGKRKN